MQGSNEGHLAVFILYGKPLPRAGSYAVAVERFLRAVARNASLAAVFLAPDLLSAQQTAAQSSAASLPALMQEAVRYQLQDFHHDDWAVRYQVHRTDGKEDSIRNVFETADGNVARTLQRNGQRLSAEEDAQEQQRLRELTAEEVAMHRRRAEASDHYGVELMTAMPSAMNYSLVPQQPQLPQFPTTQIVVDYEPRPGYKPNTTAQSLLTGLAGRIWLDAGTHHLLRMEIRITKNLNLAFGLLARVYPGGTVVYEQIPVGLGHDAYRHIDINVVLREFMVKTMPYHSTLDATDIQLLPSVPSLREAVDALLARPSR